MNKKLVTCPACGSTSTKRHENIKEDHVTLGPKFDYKEIYYTCKACHEEIDIFCETDQNFLIEQKKAQHKFIQNTIDWLSYNKISMALFERIFELPARTLTRWKEGNFSSSSLSLLRIIITYPWMIEIAENKREAAKQKITIKKENTEAAHVKPVYSYGVYKKEKLLWYFDKKSNAVKLQKLLIKLSDKEGKFIMEFKENDSL